jgi:polyisoprenoid-binding protein YceI
MKTTFLSVALLLGGLVFTAFRPAPHSETFKIDVAASKLEWIGEKVTGKHNGTINLQSGSIVNNHGALSGIVVFDMKSIVVTDLTGEYKGKLEGHLKSDDFFSVEKHPTANFAINSVTPIAGASAETNNFTVNGNLTIKGISHPLSFPANIRFEGAQMKAKGEAKVDRTKYDIKYKSASFVEDIGDKAIADEFTLKMDIVANR